jgi:hypothetical protein
MGFQRVSYKLVWPEDNRWHGLEVKLRGMNIGELESIANLRAQVKDETSLAQLSPLLDILESALLGWNYEDEAGQPISIIGFRSQDASMLLAIIAAWTEVVGDIAPPLPKASPAGEKFRVASIPMEIPSSSQPNLSTQN